MRFHFIPFAAIAAACGGDAVITGGFVEFRAELTFPGTSGEHTQTLDPLLEPEIAALARGCGQLDLAASEVYVETFEGAADIQFTLEATILDGVVETGLFDWAGLLENGGRRSSFESQSVGFSPAANTAFSDILVREDPSFKVRYRYTANGAATSAKLVVTQHFTFETDPAACK